MSGTIRIVYFAALAQQLGVREETFPLETSVSLEHLRQQLINKGGVWQALESAQVKGAVNKTMAKWDCTINPGDEVAFFPPVTGG